MTSPAAARLSRTRLSLPPGIAPPGYDVGAVGASVVHIGLGGFHRAHFARYAHDLMAVDPAALRWGIVGAGLRSGDSRLLAALGRQDGLYTLVERDGGGEVASVIGSLVDTIDASATTAELLAAIDAPAARIVSVTVSEHGHHLDSASRTLNLSDPAIRADIADPRRPRTMPGVLVEGLKRRRDAGRRAFTAMSCDNMQHNGRVLRGAVLRLAEAIDPALAGWIAEHGRFPSSMVDRITPVPTPDQVAAFASATGLTDEAPVFCEAFRQWVVEDEFADGRPDWERVGVQLVPDVAPYEAMKLRLLNASHLALASLGALQGHGTVREAVEDPLIRRYLALLMDRETGPTVPPVPGIDLPAYQATILERFANPAIGDPLSRINADAPIALLLDPLADRLRADAPIELLALALAAWWRRVRLDARGPAEGRAMGRVEAELQERARLAGDDASTFPLGAGLLGTVGDHPQVVSAVGRWLRAFGVDGVEGVLRRIGSEGPA